jgi:hypothetical protein
MIAAQTLFRQDLAAGRDLGDEVNTSPQMQVRRDAESPPGHQAGELRFLKQAKGK